MCLSLQFELFIEGDKMIRFLISFLFVFNFAYACPELDGVDLADGEGPWIYEEQGSSPITLSKEEFAKIPNFHIDSYEDCKDALRVEEIRVKASGKIYMALLTYEDSCDGGNSYGALFSEDMSTMLGDIGDSFISCY